MRDALLGRWFAAKARRRLKRPRKGLPHSLPGELIVSLTSYPARFGTLHLTLACLLDQTVRPDQVILWIAHEDMAELPPAVRELEDRGLAIRACDNLRPFKKLVPALEVFPDAFIATADDDIYFPPDWLEELAAGAEDGVVTCHRAHRIKRNADGRIAAYLQWDFDVQDSAARKPSTDILPTGAGGILYPPKALDPRVTDRALFERLTPDGDDLWFYWCARLRGTRQKKVGPRMRIVTWPGTQTSSLWLGNENENDRTMAVLEGEVAV